MGCGALPKEVAAPEPVAEEGSDLRSIVIWAAAGLRDADFAGTSDPYCVARVGPKGSTWEQKLRGTGRRSAPVHENVNPNFSMGFTVDVKGMVDPEIMIRIWDKDFGKDDDFLGDVKIPLADCKQEKTEYKLCTIEAAHVKAGATVSVSAGPKEYLQTSGLKPSAFFEEMGAIGAVKEVNVTEVTGEGPMLLGTTPGLPEPLVGIFWLTAQGASSALASFGGPAGDGGGCSAGQLVGNRYKVRVAGDRSWAFADNKFASIKFVEAADLVYHFVFDDAKMPTRCQIYPEARNLGVILTAEWLLDFEMDLLKDGDERFPGSVVWRRTSSVAGKEAKSAEYALVQVIDGKGQRIEPAWSKFVEYQNSAEAGSSPGKVYIHEAAKK